MDLSRSWHALLRRHPGGGSLLHRGGGQGGGISESDRQADNAPVLPPKMWPRASAAIEPL
jgi:hypothetical protein